jgi:hypothetical protein
MIATIHARVGVLLFALALTLPSPAEAECAWVLWAVTETALPPPSRQWTTDWVVTSAYPDRPTCEKEWKARTLNLVQDPGKLRRYACLPDTIDPRGKGATR